MRQEDGQAREDLLFDVLDRIRDTQSVVSQKERGTEVIKANMTLVEIFHSAMVEERSIVASGAKGSPEQAGLEAVFRSPEFARQVGQLLAADTELFFNLDK